MTTIYYAVYPHPRDDEVWGKFHYKYYFDEASTPITISKAFFNKYWKKVPILEKMKDKEGIFAKYNMDSNPLGTREKQRALKERGIRHTSMSVFDIVKVNGVPYMVAGVGFRKVIIK